jgi:hypothetical protein
MLHFMNRACDRLQAALTTHVTILIFVSAERSDDSGWMVG